MKMPIAESETQSQNVSLVYFGISDRSSRQSFGKVNDMSRGIRAFVLAAALAAASTVCLAQQPTFKGGTSVVSVFVTVQDAQKRLVPNLEKDKFEVLDNDKPQPITYF